MRILRRVWAETIWAPDAIPAAEAKYATPLKRFLFPAFDLIIMTAGIRALTVGMPSVETLFPTSVAGGIYWAWVVLGAACFVGAAFPKLSTLEVGGKVALFAILAVYLVTLRVVDDTGPRDVVSLIVVIAMLIPLLRLWILGIEERHRREG